MYNKEKTCVLYASEEHLITILSSYIYEEKNKEKEIVTIFEKDLTDIVDPILNIIRNKSEKKINWNKTNINSLNKILNDNLEGKTIIIFGENKFINKVNILLDNMKESFSVINCFSILKSEKSIHDIIEEHKEILTTEGVEKIKKVITCDI